MKVAALVEGIDHVCCRYRLKALRPSLALAGIDLHLLSIPKAWWSRLRLFASLRDFDAVILQRKLLQPWQLFFLRRNCKHLIFDFDDAVFLRDSYAPAGLASQLRQRRFASLLRQVDAVVAGNTFLESHTLDRPTTVIPTCVDPSRYKPARHEQNATKLVWIGSHSTLRGLESIRPWLEATGREKPTACVHLLCDEFTDFAPLPTIKTNWSEAIEADALADADVGISWLPDDSWSRGKCGLKILQYMAAGLPVIANPVGVQSDMIRTGVTGFLVNNQREWRDAIEQLQNPALRLCMGTEARRRVEQEFSVEIAAAKWIGLLEMFATGRAAA